MKNIPPTFIFLAGVIATHALHAKVAPSVEWAKCFGGSGAEYGAFAIQPTTDGGYIVAGRLSSNDGDVSENHPDAGGFYAPLIESCGQITNNKTGESEVGKFVKEE